jgi:hypothetical protein
MNNKTRSKNALVIFQGHQIRRTWYNDEWWFTIADIVKVLTDSTNPRQYIKNMRNRDEELSKGWVQIEHLLLIDTVGGKQKMSCANTEGIFRIIQSIPSKKAEPFKRWLAKVGYERIQEIENPELSQKRMKEIYKQKGYSKEWIEKRVRGIAVRNELTDEWKGRGIQDETGFAVLTNDIMKATFGKNVVEYKEYKKLQKQNLRDHMDDIEIILTMFGEATTTRLTRERDSRKMPKLRRDAKDGGGVAGNARKNFEKTLGKSVVSKENYITKQEKRKRLKDD